MMVLFAFEVDVLEILLRDSLDLLDKLFIVEAEVTHKGVSSLPPSFARGPSPWCGGR